MNNLEIVKRVSSRSKNKIVNFDSLLNIYPEIMTDAEAVAMINSYIFPLGYVINEQFQKDSIKYYACGSTNSNHGGYTGHSACGQNCKAESEFVKKLIPIIPIQNHRGSNNGISH